MGLRVSAALIVRNEARHLGACLASIAGLVDEIVVVDTGSTDDSRDIARCFGAVLHEIAWTDDFAAARNTALDQARGDWVLYIDADEGVRPCSRERLWAELADPSFVGRRVLLHARPTLTAYRELRLFRNRPEIRFRGVIHENIWPGVVAYQKAHGGRIGDSDLVLDHEGYEGDQQHKHARNLPLLRRAIADDPTHVFVRCHLASIYQDLGDEVSAMQTWNDALALVRAKSRSRADDCLPYAALIERGLGRDGDVAALLDEATRRFPTNLQFVWLRGRALLARERFDEALPCFERLVRAGERGEFDRAWAYDTRIFGLFAHDGLAVCCFKLGRYAESRRYYELAARADPSNLEYRAKAAVAARLASKR